MIEPWPTKPKVTVGEDWGQTYVQFYLPQPPSANRWWRNVNGRMVLSREARAYKQLVADAARLVKCPKIPAPDPAYVSITWHRARKAGDLDKRIGIALDALQGIVYDNDSQITRIDAKRHDADSIGARLIVIVEGFKDA